MTLLYSGFSVLHTTHKTLLHDHFSRTDESTSVIWPLQKVTTVYAYHSVTLTVSSRAPSSFRNLPHHHDHSSRKDMIAFHLLHFNQVSPLFHVNLTNLS